MKKKLSLISLILVLLIGAILATTPNWEIQATPPHDDVSLLDEAQSGDPVLNIGLDKEFKVPVDGFIHTPIWDYKKNILYFNRVDESVPYKVGNAVYFKQQLYRLEFDKNGAIKSLDKIDNDFQILDVNEDKGIILGKSVNEGDGNIILVLKNGKVCELGKGNYVKCIDSNIMLYSENEYTIFDGLSLAIKENNSFEQGSIIDMRQSKNGKNLAYITNNRELVVEKDNSKKITIENIGTGLGSTLPDIAWKNENNDIVAFTAGPSPKIMLINENGDIHIIKEKYLAHLATPSISNDDNYVFYAAKPTGAGVEKLMNLYVLNLSTGGEKQLTSDLREHRSPSLSPNGKILAYISDGSLYITEVIYN